MESVPLTDAAGRPDAGRVREERRSRPGAGSRARRGSGCACGRSRPRRRPMFGTGYRTRHAARSGRRFAESGGDEGQAGQLTGRPQPAPGAGCGPRFLRAGRFASRRAPSPGGSSRGSSRRGCRRPGCPSPLQRFLPPAHDADDRRRTIRQDDRAPAVAAAGGARPGYAAQITFVPIFCGASPEAGLQRAVSIARRSTFIKTALGACFSPAASCPSRSPSLPRPAALSTDRAGSAGWFAGRAESAFPSGDDVHEGDVVRIHVRLRRQQLVLVRPSAGRCGRCGNSGRRPSRCRRCRAARDSRP